MGNSGSNEKKNNFEAHKRNMITQATYIEEYFIQLTFTDGTTKVIDFYPLLACKAMYKPYLKLDKFKRFRLELGSLVWPGNTLDYHYTFLYNYGSSI